MYDRFHRKNECMHWQNNSTPLAKVGPGLAAWLGYLPFTLPRYYIARQRPAAPLAGRHHGPGQPQPPQPPALRNGRRGPVEGADRPATLNWAPPPCRNGPSAGENTPGHRPTDPGRPWLGAAAAAAAAGAGRCSITGHAVVTARCTAATRHPTPTITRPAAAGVARPSGHPVPVASPDHGYTTHAPAPRKRLKPWKWLKLRPTLISFDFGAGLQSLCS